MHSRNSHDVRNTAGPLQGKHLQLFPFLLTDWREWHRLHPGTLVLKPLPGYAERIVQSLSNSW